MWVYPNQKQVANEGVKDGEDNDYLSAAVLPARSDRRAKRIIEFPTFLQTFKNKNKKQLLSNTENQMNQTKS